MKGGMAGWDRFRTLVHEDETHFLELTKHFFHQFFATELVARGSEARLTVVHILAVLAVPPIFYTVYLVFTYDNIYWNFPWQYTTVSLIDHCRYVMLSMIVIGFVATLEWDALFLDRRDFAILTPLPVKAATLFTAKITALLLFLALFILAVAGVPTLLYPVVETMGIRGEHVSLLRLGNMIAAHAIAVVSSSVFIFLCFVGLHGLLINCLRPRTFKIASRFFQLSAIITLLLTLFLLLPITSNLLPVWVDADGGGWFLLFPPLWFVGVYQTVLGSGDAAFHSLAWTAAVASGLVALACGAGYIVNYNRHMQRTLEVVESPTSNRFWASRATRWMLTHMVLRKPLERAAYFFVMDTLVRSTKHRLYLTAYVGAGFALAAFGIMQLVIYTEDRSVSAIFFQPSEASLAVPLILSFFLLSGMRVVFTIPAELRANWVFQIAEDQNRLDCFAGVRKFMIVRAAQLLVALLPIYAFLWGWAPACQQLVLSLVLSLILIELLLINFRKIPFTCSYQPGKANIILLGVLYWFAFTTYAYTMAALECWLLQDDVTWIAFLVLMILLLGGLRVWRKDLLAGDSRIVYEDEPLPDIQTLNLNA